MKWVKLYIIISIISFSSSRAVEKPRDDDQIDLSLADQNSLNLWVAQQGAAIYSSLNNDPKFAYPENGIFRTSSPCWWVHQPLGSHIVSFRKHKGVSASKAMRELLSSSGRFDCRIAQRIVFMECLRRLLGDDKFDSICNQHEQAPSGESLDFIHPTKDLILDGPMYGNPFLQLASFSVGTPYRANTVGYFGYTPNIDEYAKIHFEGDLRGDHGLICLGADGKKVHYAGFGEFYKQGPKSWGDLSERFKRETLTWAPPLETPIDTSNIRESRKESYVAMMEKIREATKRRTLDLIEGLQKTYEERLEAVQYSFLEGRVFYIDLEKVRKILH